MPEALADGRIKLLPGRLLQARGRLIAAAAGVALPFSFAPYGLWWLAPVLITVLFLLIQSSPTRQRVLRGFWFGAGAFAAGTYWLYFSIHDVGGVAAPIAIVLCGLLTLLMAGYLALWGLLTALFARGQPAWQLLAVLPATWVLVEWLRSWLLSGFPWLSLGYGQIDGPLAAWAPLAGVHGVTLVLAVIAGAIGLLVVGRRGDRIRAAIVLLGLVLLTALLSGREWTVTSGQPMKVALVQGGIAQDRKWLAEELEKSKALFRDLTIKLVDADLIIWPEAAIPALAHEEEDYLGELRELMKARHQELILGILTYDFGTGEFRNSLITLGENSRVYNKRHLVPFGEYFPVPQFLRNVLRLMNLPYTDITPGLEGQRPLVARGSRWRRASATKTPSARSCATFCRRPGC
ncbi:MAG: apolipoprotein N-acyltransferase [Gammaproteobacteria bacterium]